MPSEEHSFAEDRREYAAKIVVAYLRRHQIDPSQVATLISTVHATFAQLGVVPASQIARTPAVPVHRSASHEHVICLECGWKGKTLRRHLGAAHNLRAEAYLARWQLPPTHPLVAPAYAERRSVLAKQLGLGRKRGSAAAPLSGAVQAAAAPHRAGRPRKVPA